MINDDVLIKFERKRGHKDDWPIQVIRMKQRMLVMKLGFTGIGNEDISLVEYNTITPGTVFIYDPYVELGNGVGDEAPLMLRQLEGNRCYIEGIGCGVDSVRDPNRNLFRWQDTININIPKNFLVFRVDAKPTLNGGPGYYYFYKAYRDARY